MPEPLLIVLAFLAGGFVGTLGAAVVFAVATSRRL
jgi:hypothetical protein